MHVLSPDETRSHLAELCERFGANIAQYKAAGYKEANARADFIDPLFEAIGWDVRNRAGKAEQYRDVILEDSVEIDGHQKAPDYSFRIGGVRKFFVEAKKPSVDLHMDLAPSLQVRRYSFSARLPLGILTDFEEFAVYDTRVKPDRDDKASTARIFYCKYDQYLAPCTYGGVEYPTHLDFIRSVFSPDAIMQGSFDAWAQANTRRGTSEVDREFLNLMSSWREELAKNLAMRNLDLAVRDLNLAVQRIIDRLVFLRFAEDRGAERFEMLKDAVAGKEVYAALCQVFLAAQRKYNSDLFERNDLVERLVIDDKILTGIVRSMYYPDCPYEFSVMPLEILGSAYEQFLGKTIRVEGGEKRHRAVIEEKPEVRKAGGVYYTPQYIVDYIVEETIGAKLAGSTPEAAARLKIVDPACGSGSFLIGAYTKLLSWYLTEYTKDAATRKAAEKAGLVFERSKDAYRLTLAEKRRILVDNIHGVDIDAQAVEVTKLSLFLKLLEDEGMVGGQGQLALSHEKILPNLEANIRCGNSLIGPDFYDDKDMGLFPDADLERINVFDWQKAFPAVFKVGGFDCVVGNPPYVRQEMLGESKPYFEKRYAVYHGMADLYSYFFERGISVLAPAGRFGIIVANKWMRANYGGPLRTWLRDAGLFRLVDFGDLPVFRDATTYPCIVIVERGKSDGVFLAAEPEELVPHDLPGYLEKRFFRMRTENLSNEGWAIVDSKTESFLNRLQNTCAQLSDIVGGEYYSGVKIGLDEAFVIAKEKAEEIIAKDQKYAEIIRPYLIGRDIGRYRNLSINKYAILIPKGWTNTKAASVTNKKHWLSQEYEEVASLLAPFEERAKERYDQGDYWWELRSCDYYEELGRPKIVYNKFQVQPLFTFDETGFFPNTAVFSLPTVDTALLGILNSKIGWFLISQYCTKIQNGYQLIWKYLQKLPIPKYMEQSVEPLSKVVRDMLEMQKQFPGTTGSARAALETRIAATDRQIDQLVYKLYGLTEEEIGIVEGEA